jgi:hypothetical protein
MSASTELRGSTAARDLLDLRAECARLSAWATDRVADPRTEPILVAEALAACLSTLASGEFA